MKTHIELNEGARQDELKTYVKNIVIIDEFESVLGQNTIVVALKVIGEIQANDLNSFINKSSKFVLTSDVSNVPDEDGDYLVFIDISRKTFSAGLAEILRHISNYVGIDKWKVRRYNDNKIKEILKKL